MTKYNKEEQEFLRTFSHESAFANPVFKSKLKQKMLKELEPKFNIFSFISTSGFSFVAVIAFSFLTVLTGFFILSEISSNQTNRTTTIASDQVKQQVVQKVAEQTSVTALNLLQVDEFLSNDSIAMPVKPIDDSYNLKTTQVTYIPETKTTAVCSNLNLPEELTVTQLYEYFEESKSVSKLIRNDQTVAIMEFNSSQPLSYPSSFPVSYVPASYAQANTLLDFSQDLRILQSSDNNAYTLTDSVEFDCGAPASFAINPSSYANNKDTIIREFILNPDYSVKQVNIYLNSIMTKNKLAVITINATTSNISKESANELLNTDL